jgi:streptogramin lyase
LLGTFGGGYSTPEMIVFDLAGNAYVGNTGGFIRKFDANGNFLQQFNSGRVDFLDLAADQRTVLFTQEGTAIKRYDVVSDTPLSDFATGLGSRAFALRIRPNGEVLLANGNNILRLDANGNVIQT